jgi:LysR family nitrogen assimilation transcriptional regulator
VDIRHLQGFLKIADTGSISRAAESLGLSQPSLSQQLLRLEDEIGIALFSRTARGVSLTDAGRIFQERARQIVLSAEEAMEQARQLRADPVGEAIIAVPYSISHIAGITLTEAFLRHSPTASLRLVEAMTGTIRGWIEQGKIDLGIINDLGPMRHLSSRRLAREELLLVGPADGFVNGGSVPASRLCEFPMVLPGLPHGLRQIIDAETARRGIVLNVRIELDVLAHFPRLIDTGHGYSILPRSAVSDAVAAGQVTVARIEGASFHRTLTIVRNTNAMVTSASLRCEDVTVAVLGELIRTGAWDAETPS